MLIFPLSEVQALKDGSDLSLWQNIFTSVKLSHEKRLLHMRSLLLTFAGTLPLKWLLFPLRMG